VEGAAAGVGAGDDGAAELLESLEELEEEVAEPDGLLLESEDFDSVAFGLEFP
jgi:hypothetical protein